MLNWERQEDSDATSYGKYLEECWKNTSRC